MNALREVSMWIVAFAIVWLIGYVYLSSKEVAIEKQYANKVQTAHVEPRHSIECLGFL